MEENIWENLRTRRKSLHQEPEFEDPYDTRWQQQFGAQDIRPYRTKDEYLYAMREDLADWLQNLYSIDIKSENFFEKLETGCILCQHANNVRRAAMEYKQTLASKEDPEDDLDVGHAEIRYKPDAAEGTFLARDNISNFIHWCRHCLNIKDVLLFETDDLVLRKNIKSVTLCLLEVARRGGKVGMPVPMLVQFEKEIEMELRASCMNLSNMSSVPSSQTSDSISTGPTSPSSSAATTDVEPESPSSGAELEYSFSDFAHLRRPTSSASINRDAPNRLPPIKPDSRSKSLPRSSHLSLDPNSRPHRPAPPPLRRNSSLKRPKKLPVALPKHSSKPNVASSYDASLGVDSYLSRRLKTRVSPNRHSLPLDDLHNDFDDDEPQAQIMLQPAILKSLDERVRDLVNRCTCPAQFPMVREAEGKYRIGEANTLIFVRILRNHVMVRVGGGWDTLEHYLDKHDPCMCNVHKKKKPHRAHSLRRSQSPVRRSPAGSRSQSPILRSQSPVQRVRRLSGGANQHSWANRSLDSTTLTENVQVDSGTPPESPASSTCSRSMMWRRTESFDTVSMDSQQSADITLTEMTSPLEDDDDLLSPASDLSGVERLIEESSERERLKEERMRLEQRIEGRGKVIEEKINDGSMVGSSLPESPKPKRPSRLNTKPAKTATEHLLRRRRSSEANLASKSWHVDSRHEARSAPTSPKRTVSGGGISGGGNSGGGNSGGYNSSQEKESPVQPGDVWRRFAIAGARDSASSPSASRRTRSISAQGIRCNRERSESPLTRNRSFTPSTAKRKPRPHSARVSNGNDRENKKENNVLMITRDKEGRHRLDSNSSCESNDQDSRSVDGMSSGRRTPDRTKQMSSKRFIQRNIDSAGAANKRSLSNGKEGTREQSSGRIRSRSVEPLPLTERQQPIDVGPRQSYGSPAITRRRRSTVHAAEGTTKQNNNHTRSLSRERHSGHYRRHVPSPPGQHYAKTPSPPGYAKTSSPPGYTKSPSPPGYAKSPSPTGSDYSMAAVNGNVWRKTSVIDNDLRSSLEERLGASEAYPRSRSGNSSPLISRTRGNRSRLRPVTPVPRHMKVDSHVVTPVRKDNDQGRRTRIPMPVQHKRILDNRDVRTRSLPDLIDLPRWLVRRIENTDEYGYDNFDCSQSYCSSMDSVSPTPSVKAENPNDSGYEDNSAGAKGSPLNTLSFADDASPPDASMELPGQDVEASDLDSSALSGALCASSDDAT